jgi:predicted lipoprotein with Yx(FWY)xxD motif
MPGKVLAPTTGPAAAVTFTVRSTPAGVVLANAMGRTLYWYAKDVPGAAPACAAACLAQWPADLGHPAPASVSLAYGASVYTVRIGSVTDAAGATQVTLNGHPLYTFAGDAAPGQANGNGADGVWHVIGVAPGAVSSLITGNAAGAATAPATKPAATPAATQPVTPSTTTIAPVNGGTHY